MLRTYYQGDKIEKNEMGGHIERRGGQVYAEFCWGNLRESDHLEGTSVGRRKN